MEEVENFEEYTIPKSLLMESSQKKSTQNRSSKYDLGSNMNQSIQSIFDKQKSINSSIVVNSPKQSNVTFKQIHKTKDEKS